MSGGTTSLEAALRTCKVNVGNANKLESDRFLGESFKKTCPNFQGTDLIGRGIAPDTWMTKSRGCNTPLDRIFVENAVSRPQYYEYINLSQYTPTGEMIPITDEYIEGYRQAPVEGFGFGQQESAYIREGAGYGKPVKDLKYGPDRPYGRFYGRNLHHNPQKEMFEEENDESRKFMEDKKQFMEEKKHLLEEKRKLMEEKRHLLESRHKIMNQNQNGNKMMNGMDQNQNGNKMMDQNQNGMDQKMVAPIQEGFKHKPSELIQNPNDLPSDLKFNPLTRVYKDMPINQFQVVPPDYYNVEANVYPELYGQAAEVNRLKQVLYARSKIMDQNPLIPQPTYRPYRTMNTYL
jgi:hypothetical protein